MLETSKRSFLKGALSFILVPMLPAIPAIAQRESHYDISMRRLMAKLQKDITELLQYVVFEPNDEYTRWQVQNIISMYLSEFQKMGSYVEGVGNAFIHQWKVVCDDTNNTDIQAGYLGVDVWIQPSGSLEFIKFHGLVTAGKSNEVVQGDAFTHVGHSENWHPSQIRPHHKIRGTDKPMIQTNISKFNAYQRHLSDESSKAWSNYRNGTSYQKVWYQDPNVGPTFNEYAKHVKDEFLLNKFTPKGV